MQVEKVGSCQTGVPFLFFTTNAIKEREEFNMRSEPHITFHIFNDETSLSYYSSNLCLPSKKGSDAITVRKND